MKRVHIIGKSPEKILEMRKCLESRGFSYVEENPDLVICYGGDGMFLISERVFPTVPKILIRDSDVGNMAHEIDICEVIDLYNRGNYVVEEIRKLKAVRKGRFEVRELIGVNDIVIRNSLPTEAIRFRYRVIYGEKNLQNPLFATAGSRALPPCPRDDKEFVGNFCELNDDGKWSETLIGDGLVISTAYGSNKGAYFYSIVQKKFDSGIGVAFNNVTEARPPIYLSDGDFIEVEIVRGIGVMVADNNRDFVNLENGDIIRVGLIDDVAKRVVLKDCFRFQNSPVNEDKVFEPALSTRFLPKVVKSETGSVCETNSLEYNKSFKGQCMGENMKIPVRIKRLKENAIVPRYAHEGDAALDFYSAESCVIPAGKRKLVSTGIAMELPEGYFASIRGRSGLAAKKGIDILGGVIEHTYRGEYGVVVLNTGEEDFVINGGDRIAQVVIAPVATAEVEEVIELSETVRGDCAFGSTGK